MSILGADPAAFPGRAARIDDQARLRCPACDSFGLTLDDVAVTRDVSVLVQHTFTCAACRTRSVLAMVSAFGQVVTRWI